MKPTDEQIAEWLSGYGFQLSLVKGRMWCPDGGTSVLCISDFAALYEAVQRMKDGVAQPVVPAGWRLVPEAYTLEMAAAFREGEKSALLSGYCHAEAFLAGYREMLGAAPVPPSEIVWLEVPAFLKKNKD